MLTYREAIADVKKIIHEKPPEQVEHSFTPLEDAIDFAFQDFELSPPTIPLGSWQMVNNTIKGLREHEFSVLCGPSGAGKTTMLANLAAQLISSLVPTFIASVEIGTTDFIRKLASIVSGRDLSGEIDPKILEEAKNALGSAFRTRNTVFSNYDSRVPHLSILADLYFAHKTKGTRVALIDNLNFLMEINDKNQISQMDRTIHDFVVFAKKVPIHIVMVMHPRKTENGRVESMFDIKGSSTAVQEASNVILFNRLHPKDAPVPGYEPAFCREVRFDKIRRNGKGVGSRVIFSMGSESEALREIDLR